ncbi:MAG: 50S ribosomal protein L6 [Porticoccus sp.]|jgi:large subunit ribosomal protein L6|uniref:50S ribosomal protein L6 n=1 Tax=Porticoccus TaxID=1123967 RepID=UPI000567FA8E|nr:50S ribosomal protein L6 [Porticoccus hydrocarbonoclasticus]MBG58227.1 50S ribosomal protein L6 [Porticoccus sp.]|tara:strand:+ start:7357 stop:7890 length:534 start_codon:yes stop_codon:yes gene_type:complete
MSRVAKNPVTIPAGVEVKLGTNEISVKSGSKALSLAVNQQVEIKQDDNLLTFAARDGSKQANAMAGTTRSLVNNMVLGVGEGFVKKLQLIGVGYRAQAQGGKINLTLGFSHPVEYQLPDGVSVETPSQTEILLKSADKQLLGQVASEIRAFRPPEPYKGKGVRYADEQVRRKEAKKK